MSLYCVNKSESATKEQLKIGLLMIWDVLQQVVIRKSIPSLCKCLRDCINTKGGH